MTQLPGVGRRGLSPARGEGCRFLGLLTMIPIEGRGEVSARQDLGAGLPRAGWGEGDGFWEVPLAASVPSPSPPPKCSGFPGLTLQPEARLRVTSCMACEEATCPGKGWGKGRTLGEGPPCTRVPFLSLAHCTALLSYTFFFFIKALTLQFLMVPG